ncbi:MAG: hypothetical protein AAB757_03015 [Patescibacteria group bacterium]
MENFETSRKYQMRETETQLNFNIENLSAGIESLKSRIQAEENKPQKIALEAQLKVKENELEKFAEKLRDWKERKDGMGHA